MPSQESAVIDDLVCNYMELFFFHMDCEKVGTRLRDSASRLALAMEASSRNLGYTFLTLSSFHSTFEACIKAVHGSVQFGLALEAHMVQILGLN